MNRGSDVVAGGRLLVVSRFNEAPIHESGKWRRPSAPSPARSRFNEAPIHESGKWRRCASCTKRGASLQ